MSTPARGKSHYHICMRPARKRGAMLYHVKSSSDTMKLHRDTLRGESGGYNTTGVVEFLAHKYMLCSSAVHRLQRHSKYIYIFMRNSHSSAGKDKQGGRSYSCGCTDCGIDKRRSAIRRCCPGWPIRCRRPSFPGPVYRSSSPAFVGRAFRAIRVTAVVARRRRREPSRRW